MRGMPVPGPAAAQPRLVLAVIIAFALLVRLAAIHWTIGFHAPAASEPAADSRIHIALVQNLLDGRGYSFRGAPTAITPPLYIFFLAGLYRLFGDPAAVRVTQAILGAAGCLVLYAIGRRLFDPPTALVAAGILAMYPLAVYLAGLHLTENLFLFLLLLAILQSLRVVERPTLFAVGGLGGLIGLAALTRGAFVAFLPFVLIWAISIWGIHNPLAYRIFGLAAASAVLVIIPWTVRNYLVLGAAIPIQSNAGMVFWATNNSQSDGGVIYPTRRTWTAGRPPDDGAYGWHGLNATAANRLYVQTAFSWIREHPGDYQRLLVHKLARLYGFTRGQDMRDLSVPRAVTLFHGTFLTSALGGLLLTIRQWRKLSLLLALIVFTNVVTLLFAGATRYTIPMIPSLILLAAVALVTASSHAMRAFRLERVPVGG